MATVCIFTPTYNRAYTLERLYRSLVAQTSKDFTWLVVDDGSTDDTEKLIGRLACEGSVAITYVRTENGGKQRAMNLGAELCRDELLYCLDSDDYLVPDAVEHVIESWKAVRDDPSYAGIVALRGTDENTPLHKPMPKGLHDTTLWDLYNRTGFYGDVALAHRTELLKQTPYVIDEREKFISETIVYYAIDQDHTLLVLDKILTICKYLDDGYSKNVRQLTKDNPIGYMQHHRMCTELSYSFYQKWYHTTLWIVGCKLAQRKYGRDCAALQWPEPNIISLLSHPAAWLLLKTEFR